MLTNYLKTALRNFNRNKAFFIINVSGLALGLATCIVAALFVKHEYSTDQFHEDVSSIYRVTTKYKTFNISGTPFLFTETLQSEFADVRATLRTTKKELTLRIGDNIFKHDVVLTDSNFFSFFTFPLKSGNPSNALTGLNKIVISSEMESQYFSGRDALGQVIQLKLGDSFQDFEISGVAEAIPSPSSIAFDFIIPLENHYVGNPAGKESWTNFHLTSFVRVPGDRLNNILRSLPEFGKKYLVDPETNTVNFTFVFDQFRKHHLHEGVSGGPLKPGRTDKPLKVFAGISLVILLLAGFNFMNLTNAQSSKRIVEVGIRKVAGAGKNQLVKQFLTESIVTTFFAGILALCIAEISLFIFKDLLQISSSVFNSRNLDVFVGLIFIMMITGILAGSYPAFVLSKLNAIHTFRRRYKVGGGNWLTRIVLSFQFVLSIILISCAIIMWQQQNFLITKDLGFRKDHVVILPVLPSDTSSLLLLKNELKQSSFVSNVAISSSGLTRGNSATMATFPDKSKSLVFMQSVDPDYIPTLGMTIVRGENFQEGKANRDVLVVNESLMNKFNLWDSLGMKINRSIGHIHAPTIIGVVKDFHYNDLRSGIEPFMFLNNAAFYDWRVTVRLQNGKLADGLKNVEQVWRKINPNSPFDYFFLDEDIVFQYKDVERWSTIISISTGMAIFLSILGLLGLAMFTAEQRRKEVGIRKVLGASVQQLVVLLSGNYALLILIAFVFAIPVSYYAMMNFWLNGFAFKVEITSIVYLIALFIVVLIVALPVGTQTIHAALQNPAETLKEE